MISLTKAKTPFCYGYVRVSTLGPRGCGLGLDDQRQAVLECYERCVKRSATWGGMFEEDGPVSGTSRFLDREGGAKLNEMLLPGDYVIFAKVDRIFRTLREAVVAIDLWASRGISVLFPGDRLAFDGTGPTIDSVTRIRGAIAHLERGMVSQRTKSALAVKKLRGEAIGQRPYGFKLDRRSGCWVPDEKERSKMRLMLWMQAQGMTQDDIRVRLRKLKILSFAGTPYQQQQISKLLILARGKLGLTAAPDWLSQHGHTIKEVLERPGVPSIRRRQRRCVAAVRGASGSE